MEKRIKIIEAKSQQLGMSLQSIVDVWVKEGTIKVMGLPVLDIVNYWIAQGKIQQHLPVKEVKEENKVELLQQDSCIKQVKEQEKNKVRTCHSIGDSPIVNHDFPADDIRSRTLLHWYAFEGGKFSPNPTTYPNCQGVVGWIDDNKLTPVGKRIYVVLPEQIKALYTSKFFEADISDWYDGRSNTLKLLEYGRRHNIEFPAAEYANNYCKDGVKRGEAFWPARDQLRYVCGWHLRRRYKIIAEKLEKIGGAFDLPLWSSSDHDTTGAWLELGLDTKTNWKNDEFYVSCFISY